MKYKNKNVKINATAGCHLDFMGSISNENNVNMTHMRDINNTFLCDWIYENLKSVYGFELTQEDNSIVFEKKLFTIEISLDIIKMEDEKKVFRTNIISFEMTGQLSLLLESHINTASCVKVFIEGVNVDRVIGNIITDMRDVITLDAVKIKEI